MQALLMAGGGGTRLWPLSTEEKPKQFLALFDKRSLLRTTFERVLPVIPVPSIWISGNEKHADLLLKELPEINQNHFILEPAKRDNAAAICISILLMQATGIDLSEVILMLPSDHQIKNEVSFRQNIQIGNEFLQKHAEYLLTLGITPTHPETGYGYIAYNEQVLATINNQIIAKVDRFVEKPNKVKAQEYLASGKYLWNSGIYMFTLGSMLKWFSDLLPNIYYPLKDNLRNWQTIYHNIPTTSLDYGISEKISALATIPTTNLQWNDVGDFRALGTKQTGNIATLDVSNSYLVNETPFPIRIIGLDNVIVVNTKDGLLICALDRAQDIKKLN